MEFVTPGSLKDYLMKVGPISETYISMILREMLLGLQYLQSERRCHRNLKASNVLLSDKGEVKLCDLVVGGTLGDATRLESVARAPYWIAPEVMNGNPKVEKLDKQDIWSIGITAYEIATGMTPYHNHEPMKMNLMLARDDPPRLEGEFSRSFKDFVNLCLNKEVKKRPSIKELLTHPFIRKSKKVYNLLDMVGKLNRQQQRLSQRVIDTSAVAAATAAPSHSPKRGRAFSASSITGKLRSDTGSDDGSGNELSGTLSFGRTHSPSFDLGSSGPKIGVTMSRLKNESSKFGSLGRISASHPSIYPPSSSTSSFSSSSSSSSTSSSSSASRPIAAQTSAFTPTTPTATPFAPTTTAIPPTTSTTTSAPIANKIAETPKYSAPATSSSATIPAKLDPSPASSSATPSITVTSPTSSSIPSTSALPNISSATPSINVNPPPESTGANNLNASSSLVPPPASANPLVPSGSNESINESDFPSGFINSNPLSPPHTPKVKTPLLTTPPSSSFIDSVILPVLAKKGRPYTEETQGVLNELKDAFKRLESSHAGASQQLVNDWVEAVLWENYTQPERGSPMANYLLLRWKNNTPL
eukprot:Phypoly_transcript_03784.p1 GENE.Phypoly_transcript_03784~~Phypoly_transcript_03784.p1  ORF type:complete len:690 (+),score=170.04 Phypoly_transcript_03784:309-2072(+)